MINKKSQLETLIIIVLVCITVTQFSIWGYQSFFYILSRMFNVSTNSTALDLIIGIIAMIGSVFIILGISYRILEKPSAKKWIALGTWFFVFKNVIDLINELLVFKSSTGVIDEFAISQLASNMGVQMAQLAFWVFILLYYRNKYASEAEKALVSPTV